jgi:hypothetical protein
LVFAEVADVTQLECWPPPLWTEVVVTWDKILLQQAGIVQKIQDWLDATQGGQYHLHGYQKTKGFAYRFEDPRDATAFALRWSL